MNKKLAVSLLCAGLTIAFALQNSVSSFTTGVATKPGSMVRFDAREKTGQPPDGYDYVAIGNGKDMFMALRYDGSVVVWGADRYGGVSQQPKGNNFIGM